MKKWMAVASLTALLLCGAALVANAQGPEGGPHKGWGGPGHPGMAVLRELNLSDAQKEQVKSIMKANRTATKSLRLQMEQNHAALLAATANGTYDAAKIQALAGQQGQLTTAMIVNHEALQHQIYTQVLTSEQQAKAEQLRTEHLTQINEHIKNMQAGTDTPPAPPSE